MIAALFRKDRVRSQAETLYAAAAEQARAPEFYRAAGVPDTVEGRFEALALHVFLVTRRLAAFGPPAKELTTAFQEIFFRELDTALREMGVGDLSVGRKIRGYAESFYGRFKAYELGLADSADALESAIARNVYESANAKDGARIARYVREARTALDDASLETLATSIAALSLLSAKIETARPSS